MALYHMGINPSSFFLALLSHDFVVIEYFKKFLSVLEILESSYNYMTPSQLQSVIDAIPELHIRKWYDIDVEYLFKNLYWLGLRPIEGINLTKEAFNLYDSEVRLGHTKTEKQGIAYIPPPYLSSLSAYLIDKEPGRLLKDLTYDTFYKWVIRLGVICNIEAWTSSQTDTGEKTKGHIFRKSLGKDMLYGNVPGKEGKKYEIPVISRQLRHAKVSTTVDNYLKGNLSTVKNAWA